MSKWNKGAVVLGAGLLLAVGGGCSSTSSSASASKSDSFCPIQKIQNAAPDELNDSPLVVDGAMQLRDWERAQALYANGDTPAGPTGFPYEPKWYQSDWVYPVVETPLFLGQSVFLPITLIFTPPWTEVMYKGATIETTYTAMPALPEPPEVSETPVTSTTPMPAEPAAPASQP